MTTFRPPCRALRDDSAVSAGGKPGRLFHRHEAIVSSRRGFCRTEKREVSMKQKETEEDFHLIENKSKKDKQQKVNVPNDFKQK